MMTQMDPFYHLHDRLKRYLDLEEVYEDSSDILHSFQLVFETLEHPEKLLTYNGLNSTDKQELLTGKVAAFPGLELDKEQVNHIILTSEELQLNEKETLKLWIEMSKEDRRRWLEIQLGLNYSILDSNIPLAVRELFAFDKEIVLNLIIQIAKARHQDNLRSEKKAVIVEMMNKLLNQRLIVYLVEAIKGWLKEMAKVSKKRQHLFEKLIKLASEALFYSVYLTQTTASEVNAILELIESIAESVMPKGVTASAESLYSAAKLEESPGKSFTLLVTLQLAHLCTLDQTNNLFSRNINSYPFVKKDAGNDIVPVPDDRDGMDRSWNCRLVKGFTCFAYAIQRQPYVDVGQMHPNDVTWLLREASIMQAYSYIRLCMLPVIQSNSDENQKVFLSVLCEMMKNLCVIYCLPMYHETGFPFPSKSKEQYQKEEIWSMKQKLALEQHPEVLLRDCADDVLNVITACMKAYPDYILTFWRNGKHHPFINNVVELMLNEPGLMVPTINFLTALASGERNSTTEYLYTFLKTKYPGRFDWSYFFHIIESYTNLLNPSTQNQQLKPPDEKGSTAGHLHDQNSKGSLTTPKLSPKDTQALIAVVELLGKMMNDRHILDSFITAKYQPVAKLFALMACPVSLDLKGAILTTIASVARSVSSFNNVYSIKGVPEPDYNELIAEIWHNIEGYDLLSTRSGLVGGLKTRERHTGVQFELEAVESSLGCYPVTESFLTLLLELLQHDIGIPANLGLGYRIPGIIHYVEYVYSEVLMKAHFRQYEPANLLGQGQRWKITTFAIKILTTIIQLYPINKFSVREVLDYQVEQFSPVSGETTADAMKADFHEFTVQHDVDVDGRFSKITIPRMKTSGFFVMSTILHQNRRLLELLVAILKENSPSEIQKNPFEEVDILAHRSFQILVASCAYSIHLRFSRDNQLSRRFETANYVAAFDFDNLLELPGYDWDRYIYDTTYWRQQAAVAVLGLFYEVSLVEDTFMNIIRASRPLSLIRTDFTTGIAVAEAVQLTELSASMLTAYQSGLREGLIYPISFVSEYILYPGNGTAIRCYPTIDILAIRIVSHVAKTQTSWKLLHSLSTENTPNAYTQSLYLTYACTSSLLSSADSFRIREICDLNQLVVPRGGYDNGAMTIRTNFYTPSGESNQYQLLDSLKEIFLTSTQGNISSLVNNSLFPTTREAVVDLLLESLYPDRLCLCHQLLGLKAIVEDCLRSGKRLAIHAANNFPIESRVKYPANCLDALIEILQSQSSSSQTSLFDQPDFTSKCFELLYRMCSSPLTSAIVLTVMRKRSTTCTSAAQFLKPFIQQCIKFLEKQVFTTDSLSLNDYKKIESALNSAAWMLKLVALEMHTLELSPLIPQYHIKDILKMLFEREPADIISTAHPEIFLISILKQVPFLFPPPRECESALVLQCLLNSQVSYSPSRGMQLNSNTAAKLFHTVDIKLFVEVLKQEWRKSTQRTATSSSKPATSSLRQDLIPFKPRDTSLGNLIEYGINYAVHYNQYNMIMAAASNLCQGWRLVVDMTLLGCGMLLLDPSTMSDVLGTTIEAPHSLQLTSLNKNDIQQKAELMAVSMSKLFKVLILPTIDLSVANLNSEILLAEHIGLSILSMVNLLKSASVMAHQDANETSHVSHEVIFSTQQIHSLLSGIIRLLTKRPVSSTIYRVTLYSAIILCLRFSASSQTQPDSTKVIPETILELIESSSGNMTSVIIKDIISGPASVKYLGISILCCILSTMVPLTESISSVGFRHQRSHHEFLSSKSFNNCLHILKSNNSMEQILISSGLTLALVGEKVIDGRYRDEGDSSFNQLLILQGCISLCVTLSSTSEGAELIINLGVMESINSLPSFHVPFSNGNTNTPNSAFNEYTPSTVDLESLLGPILKFWIALLKVYPTKRVITEAETFLFKNHLVISFYLRLHSTTIASLKILDDIIVIFGMISALTQGDSELFKAQGSTFDRDISKAMKDFGLCPVKSWNVMMSLIDRSKDESKGGSGKPLSWWDRVLSSTDHEKELAKHSCEPPLCLKPVLADIPYNFGSKSNPWSQFDTVKLNMSQQIVVHLTSFYRIRITHLLESSRGGATATHEEVSTPSGSNREALAQHNKSLSMLPNLQQKLLHSLTSLDHVTLCIAFRSLALLYFRIIPDEDDDLVSIRADESWLSSTNTMLTGQEVNKVMIKNPADREIAANILTSLENLLIALHDIYIIYEASARSNPTPGFNFVELKAEFNYYLSPVENFPSHSFLRQVARYIIGH